MNTDVPPNFHAEVRLWSEIKHDILRKYLKLFINKLGARGRIYYVDGFAGQGKYDDGKEGSPLIAARIAGEYADRGRDVLRCINVEMEPDVFQNLKHHTNEFASRGLISNICGSFEDRLDTILGMVGNDVVLFFIDPFGAKGIELPLLEKVRSQSKGTSEILLRFDDLRIGRTIGNIVGLASTSDLSDLKTARSLRRRLEGVADPELIAGALDSGKIDRQKLIDGFCNMVVERGLYRFALSYPIVHPLTKGHRYFLVHFCNHPDGYTHMADFMAKAERSLSQQKDSLFNHEDLPFIAEALEEAVRKTNIDNILKALPSILLPLRTQSRVCWARDVFGSIVVRFGWKYLRKEWTAALRQAKEERMLNWDSASLEDSTKIRILL
jgi:three-Cys-motif partner protein